MDKEDADFLHILFRENNELRLKYNAGQRELYNKTVQYEAAEEEIRQLKLKAELSGNPGAAAATPDRASTAASGLGSGASRPTTTASSKRPKGTPDSTLPPPAPAPVAAHPTAKELQEALFSLERKNAELKLLNEDYNAIKGAMDDQMAMAGKTPIRKQLQEAPQADTTDLKIEIEIKDGIISNMKKQAIEMATDADRKNNELQNQLQGVETLIEGIRKEYEEFIQVTKLETESFRTNQLNEYNELKASFEALKLAQFDEKKRLASEYAGLLHSMQSQFEEYRTATEYMFNSEIAKLEEELSHQSLKFEHEVMYVIQAKDKFYADMMVSKDAKIMNLIEGSDLQTLMQKHEMDTENLRKDHAREIEMVKSDQESEQKNLISLLQRHNVSLESKCEKLQAHLKTLEMRIRELMGTIETKMKIINDREEQKIRLEAEYESKLAECHAQITALGHEKEHLRHKVIRLNLNAKGEGGNSIENMIKRISRETTDLHVEFEQLSIRYDSLIGENQVLVKRLKEREKFAEFMEKEVARRTEEYLAMTNTFEEFLLSRARQSRRDRSKKLPKIQEPPPALLAKSMYKPSLLKSVIPDRDDKSATISEEAGDRKLELERGNLYLRKFKTLSRAFATGDFRILPNGQYNSVNAPEVDTVPGPWQKSNLYRRMDDASLALAKLYREPAKTQWDPSSKPTVYSATQNGVLNNVAAKVYTDTTTNELKLLLADEKLADEASEDKPDIKAQILLGKSLRKRPAVNA
ncbi:hypothetical protein BDR26DRAFT_857979 [Obelidium mucronatum]|nr:hypothetical protein BDR26DRAFT_857979 [Obelidium mucronatum]